MKKPLLFLIASTLLLMQGVCSYAQRITVTVAGNGSSGFSGDSGPAKKATLTAPNDICIDAAHNLYFSDQTNAVIRKVTSRNGVISTIAGGGTSSADGIPAISASVNVGSLCADATGNVYFVSLTTNTLRRIDAATNIITTVAGAGTSTADGIPAVSASLAGLNSVCIDVAGNLYLLAGNRLRKIDAATGMITTIAGTATAGYTGDGGAAVAATLSAPKYIAVDHTGNLYFGDQGSGGFGDYVRRIDGTTGIITTIIGGGGTLFGCLGSAVMIGGLSGLCCDGGGDVIFNEWSCSCRKWDHGSHWVSLIGGDFGIESFHNDTSSAFAYMNNNYGICSDEANNYYIADRGNNRVRRIIQLTSAPSFAFGEGQSMKYCPGGSTSINELLWVTDQDAGQTETWTVVTPPSGGTLGGFPATALSNSTYETAKPSGLSYTALPTYTGADSFVVMVSDGLSSNVIKVFIQVSPLASVAGPDNVCVTSTAAMIPTVPGGVWSLSNTNASISASGIVTGVTAGSDNVLYTVDNGCAVITITKPVSVVVYPDAGTITGYETICAGSSALFTDPSTGGVWSATTTNASVSPTGVVLGMSGGTDVINYTVTNSCGTSTTSKTINITPLPDPGTISGSDEVCTQSSITLVTTAPTGTGNWTYTNSHVTISPSGVVTGVSAGVDTIIYRAMNECAIKDATKIITVKDCAATNLPVVSNDPSISIYPNPASAMLNINWNALPGSITNISLTDVAGRVVLRDVLNSSTGTKGINVSALNDGVYMLTINGDGMHSVNKVVISK